MTKQELRRQLESEFELVVFSDLGEISTSPTRLHQLLDGVYQSQYQVQQRLVFYTAHPVPQDLLRHLYQTLNFIDISNWFVLICGPKILESQIIESCQLYSHDPVPIQFRYVDIEQSMPVQDQYGLSETMCAIPWTNLEIKHNGEITPCCMTVGLKLGRVQEVSLDDAFNSNTMKKLRQQLLAGERPECCNNCWKVEDRNLTSIRMHNISRYKKDFLNHYLDQPKIATLDIKFNNTCNFKCRICSSVSSSLYAQEQHKFLDEPLVVQDNWGESEDFIDQIIFHLPSIKNIDMYGGEPFLIKKFNRVLELAVNTGCASSIRLHYNSNGSIWPEHLLPYWSSFKMVDLHFSIDAIGAQFELQRGGQWSYVEQNILRLRDLALPNLSISIMPAIGAMNVYYIDQVYDWAKLNGFPIFITYVRKPGLELSDLTPEAKNLIFDKFKNHPWEEIQNLLKTLQNLPDSDGIKFQNTVKWFDQVREEKFARSHAEIAKAMGYM